MSSVLNNILQYMVEYDASAILLGTIGGMVFSVAAAFLGFSGPGILTSNVISGFTASCTTKGKGKYIINGGVSGITSSLAMLVAGFLLQGTPAGFSNWNTWGLFSLGLL
ncbi:hypothetical protein MSWAN_0252 [Methanobacterium paludis]|uniref:Uncharacterized protein n=2 Tax=Methanobacterium paludis (strain DSM 25820 / JCM 18151 / SWAN1) TaxID=868131 RepID=F6D209_METPW|nr:hypothetical protein MSWAN_0252 [Methanobacterium paludis]